MGWACAYCTLINETNEEICDGCGSAKVAEKPQRRIGAGIRNVLSGAVSMLSTIWDDVREVTASAVTPPAPPSYNVYNAAELYQDSSSSMSSPARSHDNSSDSLQASHPACRRVRKCEMPSTPEAHGRSAGSLFSSPMKDQSVRDEREAHHLLKQIRLLCSEIKTTFIDDQFPPSNASIGNLCDSEDGAVPGRLHNADIVWLRPTQMNTKDGRRYCYSVFNDPSSSDIEQGSLGDCWLLSALAQIAERPDVLEKIFLTREYDDMGVYQVRLCVDGRWRVITLDDYFPCRKSSKTLAFAVGRKNQLWVPLVEKAYAKALGNYSMLKAGRTVEGLALLTGAPCETINLEDEELEDDIVWARLLSAREAGYIMGTSCGAGGKERVPEEVVEALGLLTKHAYSILDVRQEGEHRLLYIRNPWGTHVWKGDWSDKWKEWPDEIKNRLLSREKKSQGAFWMCYEDFRLYFDSIDFAKVRHHLSWAELRMPCRIGGSWRNDATALMLVVEQPTELCCSLFRGGSRSANDHEDLLICVHNVDAKGQLGKLDTRSKRSLSHMATTGDFFLRPGHYVITVFSLNSFNRGKFRLEAMLVVHSNKLLFGDAIACPPEMATESLVQIALKEAKETRSIHNVVSRFVTKSFGGLLVMVDNLAQSTYVHVTCDCDGSTNILSTRGALCVYDIVPPQSRQILVVLSHFDASNGYVVQNQMTMKSTRTPALSGVPTAGGGGDAGSVLQHWPSLDNDEATRLHTPRAIT